MPNPFRSVALTCLHTEKVVNTDGRTSKVYTLSWDVK